MIKINLLPKALNSKAGTGQIASIQDVVDQVRDALGGNFRDSPLRKLLLPVIVVIVANSLDTDQRTKELAKADAQLQVVSAEATTLRQSVAKTKSLETLKTQLEADEKEIRTKLEVIHKLIDDRANPPKMMLSLSNSLPAELWLSEINIGKTQVVFRGGSVGFNPISDFMKALGDNEFFKDVELKGSEQQQDSKGLNLATFEVNAELR